MAPVQALRLTLLTVLVMIAFAANSLIGREALDSGAIDAASFTLLRLAAGAAALWIVITVRHRRPQATSGSWSGAWALFGYAAAFSFAYHSLSAGTGALILFGAVQATMIGYGLWRRERLSRLQIAGMLAAGGGLVYLMLPGIEAPPIGGALLMLLAGLCWGVYSLIGRGVTDPTAATASNFIRATPLALLFFGLSLAITTTHLTPQGAGYALLSGAITSGLAYALWYAVLPALRATTASIIQLSVPVIAALGGAILLNEAITFRLTTASIVILGGIAVFVLSKRK